MKKLSLYAAAFGFLGLFFSYCAKSPTVAGSGSETQNALVMGRLYKSGSPAIGAKVFFVKVNYNPNPATLGKALVASDTAITDSTGTYGTNDLDSGTYNVFGQDNSGNLSLIDSFTVTGDSQVVPPDTLKLPGSLEGYIKMQGTDNATSVLIMPFGTFYKPDPTPVSGAFSLPNLAEGQYSIRFMSILDRYLPLDTTFTITAGASLTLPDSIRLPLRIPTPTGLKIAYDTLKQIVTLSWNNDNTGRVKGYNVYRQHVDSAEVKLNALPLANPIYVDSTGVQDQTYIYSVVAVDFENKEGIRMPGDSVKIEGVYKFVKTITNSSINNTFGLYLSDEDVVVVGSYNNALVKLDTNNNLLFIKKNLKAPDSTLLVDLLGMAIDKNGSIFQAAGNGLFKLDSLGAALIQFDSIPHAAGVALNSSFVFATDGESVFKFNYDGNLINKWSSYGNQVDQIMNAYSLFVINDTVIVCDADNRRIQIFNTDGAHLGSWGSDGAARGQFSSRPMGIAIHPNGNIYVVESNGRLTIFDRHGGYIGHFIVDVKNREAESISVNKSGEFAIGVRETIHLYKTRQ